jgi:urea carboxylase
VVAAIYPAESPGGYQLYGRTMPGWHTWGKGDGFSLEKPWILQPFDQVICLRAARRISTNQFDFKIRFEVISEDEYGAVRISILLEDPLRV